MTQENDKPYDIGPNGNPDRPCTWKLSPSTSWEALSWRGAVNSGAKTIDEVPKNILEELGWEYTDQ